MNNLSALDASINNEKRAYAFMAKAADVENYDLESAIQGVIYNCHAPELFENETENELLDSLKVIFNTGEYNEEVELAIDDLRGLLSEYSNEAELFMEVSYATEAYLQLINA